MDLEKKLYIAPQILPISINTLDIFTSDDLPWDFPDEEEEEEGEG